MKDLLSTFSHKIHASKDNSNYNKKGYKKHYYSHCKK